VPKGWREGDALFVAGGARLTLAGSEYQARFGELGGSPGSVDLEAEARLVGFLWRAAPECSLVHDASEGGLAVCLAEAAVHSGLGARLELADDPLELFGEVGGRAVLACSPGATAVLEHLASELGVPLLRAGTAGGATLFGAEVSQLRDARESI
jgi:phosphoribosylformylglycinamidine synthase